MDLIVNKDTSTYNVQNDTDFALMLRERLGENAANWYIERLARIDVLLDEMRPLLPPEDEMKCGKAYDFEAIKRIGEDKLSEIAVIAYEIPGWDE